VEILKDFFVGLISIVMGLFAVGIAVFLFPFIIAGGAILLIALKGILFLALCIAIVILIGYLVRKALKTRQ